MLETFKKYCKLKNDEHKYGYMRVDKDGKLFVETLKGDIITHVAYQHYPKHNDQPHWYHDYVDKFISISYATCGYTEKCQIGKPQQKCVDEKIYSKNKCAVVFAKLFDVEKANYHFNAEQLKAFKI